MYKLYKLYKLYINRDIYSMVCYETWNFCIKEVAMREGDKKGAWTTKVGEKGQIVIPKEARDLFGIAPGDTLLVLWDKKKGLAIVKADKLERLFQAVIESDGE